jgi:CelD/BcsL family acetyltransferase involved in cellulose biosynthesis
MTVLEAEKIGGPSIASRVPSRLTGHVQIIDRLREAEPLWRTLETAGLVTPYQTYDWATAWAKTVSADEGSEAFIALVRDARGRLMMLLPLCISKTSGLRIAQFMGGKHANMNLALLDRHFAMAFSADDIRRCLASVAERQGIDLFHFENQPLFWQGIPNPILLLPHQPSANSAWKTALVPDADEMVKGLMSSESRKKLRHKERKLADFGAVTYREARDADEALAVLDAFLAQKAQRFAAMGIANPFSEPGTVRFLQAGVTQRLPEGRPAIVLHAMRAGDRILSVFGGAIQDGRYSGMFTSFDADPVVAKYSPGDLLLLNLIRDMCGKGLHTFDLGTGDAAYKNDYCSTEEPLADSFIPFTTRGRLAAFIRGRATAGKRAMKKSPAMAGLLSRFRKLKRR